MDTFWLVLRVVVSLAVVLGLIWALARVRKRVGPTGSDVVTVMSKIPVTKKGSVLLVKAGGETLLLGATDTQISLLASVELPQEEEEAKEERTPVDVQSLMEQIQPGHAPAAIAASPASIGRASNRSVSGNDGPLAGSILSPSTWRQLTDLLKEKTARS